MNPNPQRPPLLASQLRLVALLSGDVRRLPGSAREHDAEVLDAMTDDLVGARLVIRAALAAPHPHADSGAARAELVRREREATALLGAVISAPRQY